MKNLITYLGLLTISYSVHAEKLKLNYINYLNEKNSIELMREKEKITLTLGGFTNSIIELQPVMNGTVLIDGAYDSGVLKKDVRSKSDKSVVIHSIRLTLNEGKFAAENQKTIDELRKALNEMFHEGSIKFSGDHLCPKNSMGILMLAIKDAFLFPFCITAQ